MADGNNRKAIMPQGIVRNQTKIGVQDGQSDDLVNLRFLDGSWRASGNGRQIENFSGTGYTQLYVHTNVYHHLLGVHDGTLYWFAEIGTDGVTFYPLDSTTDRSQWTEGMINLPTEPVALTTVTGDMWVTQTGHLLTIIDEADDFEHFVFKTSTKEYIEVNMNVNGKVTDRSLYPFGQVHFNWYVPRPDLLFEMKTLDTHAGVDMRYFKDDDFNTSTHKYFSLKEYPSGTTIDTGRDLLTAAYGELREYNKFTGPRLACIAARLYDGSYAYASNPILIHPREQSLDKKIYFTKSGDKYIPNNITTAPNYQSYTDGAPHNEWTIEDDGICKTLEILGYEVPDSYHEKYKPTMSQFTIGGSDTLGIDRFDCGDDIFPPSLFIRQKGYYGAIWQECFAVFGYDIAISVEDVNFLRENKDVFSSLCVFVSPEIQDTEYNNKDYTFLTALLSPRKNEDVVHDLLYTPLYLLKEYKVEELNLFQDKMIIDLSKKEDEGLLSTLVENDPLPTEVLSRTTYLPKVSYMYNGRLHIADYKSHAFLGYPIDLFHLHNHSVKVQDSEWFPADTDGQRVLPNLADNNDAYLQYPKTQHCFPATYSSTIKYFAYITVDIDTAQGIQRVVRYIEPYEIGSGKDGRADFIESLNPLLTYPDARAKSMSIRIFKEETTYQGGAIYLDYYKTVELKPHPYLNIAYYIDPDLKPIEFEISPSPNNHILPEMQNTDEYFPNGLKVSKTDQPMFFSVENTYQIGSAEILALMSNSIAVGTGQTGAAPLYVFCKDGVYALFVDASGQMTYTNSRILARDVCNNARSVTPIDAGVVFTTDRGLMMITGEQVEEIGAPAEGDVFRIEDYEDAPYDQQHPYVAKKIMWHRFTADAFANLPQGMLDGVDFLTYISGAIINYNHNLRELMVSNEKYPYSYVMDRDGQWSRRSFTADEYVNNYPTSYRVKGGTFYKVDDEGNSETSLEHRKEADNSIFWLSNIIKLDSIGFKELHRLVIRGYFETIGREELYLGLYIFGSYDGRQWAMIGGNERQGKFTDIGCKIERADIKFIRVCLAGQVTGKSRIDYIEVAFDPSILNTKIR